LVFSDPSFLFYFLPVVLALYWVGGWRKRNFFLLIVSLFFYIAGGGALVMLLVASGLLTYSTAHLIDRTENELKRKLTRGITVSVLLACLLFWKYSEFMLNQFSQLMSNFGSQTNLTIDLI
jgi:alginate O-acetyltransferase complex protein AlgI